MPRLLRPQLGTARDEPFEAFLQGSAGQHHVVAAGATAQANIRAKAVHRPLKAAAWVRLAQPHDVVDAEVDDLCHAHYSRHATLICSRRFAAAWRARAA